LKLSGEDVVVTSEIAACEEVEETVEDKTAGGLEEQ